MHIVHGLEDKPAAGSMLGLPWSVMLLECPSRCTEAAGVVRSRAKQGLIAEKEIRGRAMAQGVLLALGHV